MVGGICFPICTYDVVLASSGCSLPAGGRRIRHWFTAFPPVLDWVAIWITSFTYGSHMYHY